MIYFFVRLCYIYYTQNGGNDMKQKQIRLICSTVLTVLLILAALCLMIACIGIYNAGDQPFSRESVAEAFRRIRIPVYLCLAGILLSFLTELFLPGTAVREKASPHYPRILDTWLRKVDPALCSPETRREFLLLEKRRKLLSFLSGLVLGLCSTAFLVYALDGSHFHDSGINASVVRATGLLLAAMLLPVCLGICSSFYATYSLRRQILLLQNAGDSARRPSPLPAKKPSVCQTWKLLRVCVFCAALALLLVGFFSGGTADVMTKAINICTECVGLG